MDEAVLTMSAEGWAKLTRASELYRSGLEQLEEARALLLELGETGAISLSGELALPKVDHAHSDSPSEGGVRRGT